MGENLEQSPCEEDRVESIEEQTREDQEVAAPLEEQPHEHVVEEQPCEKGKVEDHQEQPREGITGHQEEALENAVSQESQKCQEKEASLLEEQPHEDEAVAAEQVKRKREDTVEEEDEECMSSSSASPSEELSEKGSTKKQRLSDPLEPSSVERNKASPAD